MPTLAEGHSDRKIVDVVEVISRGDQIIIPEKMSLERVDAAIHQKMAFDETDVNINAVISGFVTDAAYNTHKVMVREFGWVNPVAARGEPPTTIEVEVERGKSVEVPFGRFTVANIDGYIEFGVAQDPAKKGVAAFVVGGVVKQKHKQRVLDVVALARKELAEHSIYKGKAFRLRVRDEQGRPLPFPTPQFLDLNPSVESELIFPEDVMFDIETNLFTPIEHTEMCRERGIPLKRGVLLAGDFGVGKTMAAHATALKCVRNDWSYIVCERGDELADVLRAAVEHARPCVVFNEDIDRVMAGERDVDIDHILNVIDGVESKNSELMIVLTTNDIDNIHPALLRPGRLDAVIYVDKPDAVAAERLARQYGRGLIDATEDITEACTLLAGRIPAVIRETVERSKLAAIALSGGTDSKITNKALLHAAKRMQFQLDKLEPKKADLRSETVKATEMYINAQKDIFDRHGAFVAQPFLARDGNTAYLDDRFSVDDNGNRVDHD